MEQFAYCAFVSIMVWMSSSLHGCGGGKEQCSADTLSLPPGAGAIGDRLHDTGYYDINDIVREHCKDGWYVASGSGVATYQCQDVSGRAQWVMLSGPKIQCVAIPQCTRYNHSGWMLEKKGGQEPCYHHLASPTDAGTCHIDYMNGNGSLVASSGACAWWNGNGVGLLAEMALLSFSESSSEASQPYNKIGKGIKEQGEDMQCPDDPRRPHPTLLAGSMYLDRGHEELVHALETWDAQGIILQNMTYVVRSINFTGLAEGYVWEAMAPFGNAISELMAPLQHHMVAFEISTRPMGNISSIGPYTLAGQSQRLVLHLMASGVRWSLSTSGGHMHLAAGAPQFTSHVAVRPQWVAAYLEVAAHRPYSCLHWNCQHFARGMASFINSKCRQENKECHRIGFEDDLPSVFYGSKVFWIMAACIVLFSTATMWSCCTLCVLPRLHRVRNGEALQQPLDLAA